MSIMGRRRMADAKKKKLNTAASAPEKKAEAPAPVKPATKQKGK